MPLQEAQQYRRRKGYAADKTKERLIEAGVELFARYSFDGVSTRNLADRADVNLASIQYYFGSKEGLYLAVARHIVERVRSWMAPHISRIDEVLMKDNPGKETCFLLYCDLMDELLARALTDSEPKRWMGIFMREQIEPTGAFDILYDGIMKPVHNCFCRLTALILDLMEEDQEVKIRSYALSGALLMFHISRAEICRTMNWDGYNAADLDAIRKIVFEHSRAVFGMPGDLLEAYFAAGKK